ncbi:MAG: hypothetical protein EBZ59_11335 [Planctomycetia bacterium]|nr:hypothetical protein [Planctomycetia bacterium]
MKGKLTQKDQERFVGAMQFLEMMAPVQTRFEVDLSTGKGTVKVWFLDTNVVLHLETVDVRRIRVVEREKAVFPDKPPKAPQP